MWAQISVTQIAGGLFQQVFSKQAGWEYVNM